MRRENPEQTNEELLLNLANNLHKWETINMEKDEAIKVLQILSKADGELFSYFVEEFPEFSEIAKTIFKEKFNKDLDE